MGTRVAILSIIVENGDSVAAINDYLHGASSHIIGRFGLPYRVRGVSIICIVLDAPQDVISALSGRIGALDGVTCKALYSNL